MRFAYADPPYLGCGKKHYAHQHEAAADYDDPSTHRQLVVQLRDEFPDGWACSLHTPSIEEYSHICRAVLGPDAVRWGSWVKPFASFKKGVNPAYTWEPVIFFGGRPLASGKKVATMRDYVSANITTKKGTSGAKPDPFSFWLFDMLGMNADDELHDLFPGTGAVTRAYAEWKWHRGRE